MNLKIPENPSRKITQTHSRVTKKSRKRFYTAWTRSGHSNAKDDLRYDTLIINKRQNSAFHFGAGIFCIVKIIPRTSFVYRR